MEGWKEDAGLSRPEGNRKTIYIYTVAVVRLFFFFFFYGIKNPHYLQIKPALLSSIALREIMFLGGKKKLRERERDSSGCNKRQ